MFASGMSARSVAQALESIFELKYLSLTISQISQVTVEEITKWKQRKLKERYIVLGIDEEGYWEILDFEVNLSEGAESWLEMIRRLYERRVREVLLFVADGVI